VRCFTNIFVIVFAHITRFPGSKTMTRANWRGETRKTEELRVQRRMAQ